MSRKSATAAVLIATSTLAAACSGGKPESTATTTTVVRPPALADYAPRVAELAADGIQGSSGSLRCDETTTLLAIELCFRQTSDRLSVVTQIDPILRQMPQSESVDKALTMSQEMLSLNAEWTSRRCATITSVVEAMREKCAATPMAVDKYFQPFAEQIAALAN